MNKESISAVLGAVTVISLIVGTSVYFNQTDLNNNAVQTSKSQEEEIDKVFSLSSPSPSSSSMPSTTISSSVSSSDIRSSDLDKDPVPASNEIAQVQTPIIIKLNKTEFEQIGNSQFKKAPEFADITDYVNTNNSEPLRLEDLRDKVVLVNFWTYSCINCIRTLPFINDWNEKYADKGLVIVGIHTPEFEFEKDNVRSAADKFGIKYPVLQDNDKGTWNAFENRYWPRKYVIDTEGYIRYDHIGEGAYQETEKVIQYLLAERAAKMGEMEIIFSDNLQK